MTEDKERIERFLRGDESGFNELVREYHQKVYQFFYHLTFNREEADEMTQLTFIRVYKGLGNFKGDSAFSTWLYRVAYNTGMSYLKRERVRRFLSLDVLRSHKTEMDFPQEKSNLSPWIGKLPDRQRLVMLMRLYQELPFKVIAGILDISENTAKVHFSLGVSNLRKILEKEGISYNEL